MQAKKYFATTANVAYKGKLFTVTFDNHGKVHRRRGRIHNRELGYLHPGDELFGEVAAVARAAQRAADPSDESVHYPLGHPAECGKHNGSRDLWINDPDLVSCPRCRERAARLATPYVQVCASVFRLAPDGTREHLFDCYGDDGARIAVQHLNRS